MLKNLIVQNYALIDNLEIDFHQGLNIITGETGAGKSILLGALGLILGSRAEVNVLKDKTKPCIVEGAFDFSGYNLQPFFHNNDLEYQDNTTIRRHINIAGKSRAFVNELPVNLSILKDLVSQVIDIHSQHENLLLSDNNFQLSVLDSFTDNSRLVIEYGQAYSIYKHLVLELDELKAKAEQAKADLDYMQFQLNQLDEAKLVVGEEIELEALQQQLLHAEEIKSTLQMVASYLNADDASILLWLKDAQTSLARIEEFFPAAKDMVKRLESARLEMKDLAQEVDIQSEKIEADPKLLEVITQRLDLIITLQQKHRVGSVGELIDIRNKLKGQVDVISNYDNVIESTSIKVNEATAETLNLAHTLSERRKKGSKSLEKSIIELLSQLGMPYADFSVQFKQLAEPRPLGIDHVTFLFSANKQMPLQEMAKVASGGELSRLMLSLKSLMVKTKGLPTIILDEIDTGVSGEVADKVGNIINGMAQGMQVINITHLPQIACKGKYHFLVFKEYGLESTKTSIRLLNSEERVTEIAKMLSGEKISEAAIINAKHLLSNGLS
jgi:DNA repair protein RecN (Recombination protein N)